MCAAEASESADIPRTWAKEGANYHLLLGLGEAESSLEREKVGFDESGAH